MSYSADGFNRQNTAEREIPVNEAIFRKIMENSHDAIALTDNNGNIIEWNLSAERLFGIAKSDAIGQALWDIQFRALPDSLKTPQVYEKIKYAENQFLQTGKAPEDNQLSEVEIQHSNGLRRIIQTTAFSIKCAEGFNLCSISSDITERKRTETSLQNSRKMLQTVLDAIPAEVFWKSHDYRYLGANRTWLNAVGFKSPEDVIGKSDFDLPWKEEQARSFREYDKRVMESGIAEYDIIEPYILGDGTEAWARTNKVPLLDADGNITGVLGTYEDITERKQMEEELHKAQKLESLGLLAGGIAHDFNNLMGGLFGYIDLALASTSEGAVSNSLFSAINVIDRARDLTSQLRLSRNLQ